MHRYRHDPHSPRGVALAPMQQPPIEAHLRRGEVDLKQPPMRQPMAYGVETSRCKPGEPRFIRREIRLTGGAPVLPVNIVTARPEKGVLYSGFYVDYWTDYDFLIRQGILEISVRVGNRQPFILDTLGPPSQGQVPALQNPGATVVAQGRPIAMPMWIPRCIQHGETVTVLVDWTTVILDTDSTTAFGTAIYIGASVSFGTSEFPPIEEDDRFRRRVPAERDLPNTVFAGGAALAQVSAVISPVAEYLYLTATPAIPGTAAPLQYAFAAAGAPAPVAPTGLIFSTQTQRIRLKDLRTLFIGDPLGAGGGTLRSHREVWRDI